MAPEPDVPVDERWPIGDGREGRRRVRDHALDYELGGHRRGRAAARPAEGCGVDSSRRVPSVWRRARSRTPSPGSGPAEAGAPMTCPDPFVAQLHALPGPPHPGEVDPRPRPRPRPHARRAARPRGHGLGQPPLPAAVRPGPGDGGAVPGGAGDRPRPGRSRAGADRAAARGSPRVDAGLLSPAGGAAGHGGRPLGDAAWLAGPGSARTSSPASAGPRRPGARARHRLQRHLAVERWPTPRWSTGALRRLDVPVKPDDLVLRARRDLGPLERRFLDASGARVPARPGDPRLEYPGGWRPGRRRRSRPASGAPPPRPPPRDRGQTAGPAARLWRGPPSPPTRASPGSCARTGRRRPGRRRVT
jgi:hypothetical protein